MAERIVGESKWRTVKIGIDAILHERELDPEILAQMPPAGSKTFIQVGPIEFFVGEVKRFFKGRTNSLD